MSLVTPDDFNSYGGSGTFTNDELQMAIDLAEFDVGAVLCTYMEPTSVEEEYLWPADRGKILLNKKKLISITEVTAKYSLDADCVWIEDVQCGVILDAPNGLVKVQACNFTASNCMCSGGNYPYGANFVPDRLVITYICGFTAAETDPATNVGKALRMAIILRAREWLNVLTQGQNWEGNFLIKSWNSMDYGERRDYMETFNSMGPGPMSQESYRILMRLNSKTAVMLRSSGRY